MGNYFSRKGTSARSETDVDPEAFKTESLPSKKSDIVNSTPATSQQTAPPQATVARQPTPQAGSGMRYQSQGLLR
jgi:hypothetical protein